MTEASNQTVIIKKYANRRLYNTETSSYVTLDYLAQMIRQGRDFKVVDAKSQEDITRSVLTQIIVEQENSGQTLLPLSFLRQLIGLYDNGFENLLPRYLESSLDAFTGQQEQLRTYFSGKTAPTDAFAAFDDIARKNIAMFEQATRMFGGVAKPKPQAEDDKSELETMREQLHAMQSQLDKLARKD